MTSIGAHQDALTAGTYAELVREAAARHGNAELLIFPGSRLTYAGLLQRAEQRGRELRALGLGPGDRVGLLLPNCQEYVEVLFGALLLGAVAVPINVRFKARELGHVIDTADLEVLVTRLDAGSPIDFRGLVEQTQAEGDGRRCAIADVTAGSTLAEPSAEPLPPSRAQPADIAMLVFTSGTTANPKGCMITHDGLVRNARNWAGIFELGADDHVWNPLPFFHLASVVPLAAVMTVGGRFVSMEHFDPALATRMLADEGVTLVYSLFPAITLDLIHHPRFAERRPDGIRTVCNIAPPDVQRNVMAAFPGAQLVSAYGITEATAMVAFNWPDDAVEHRIATCGRPFRGLEAAIVDLESGRRLPAHEKGELLLRGPTVFKGYFGDPTNTRSALDDDGWLHTGDICSLDDGGRIVFHGRQKDMLKVGGENVGALEVESTLARHPAVKLAQVVGVPDERLEEVPAAFIELAPGASATEEDMILFCRGQIASFKVPRYVRFVSEWPMSATKIQKFVLRDRLVGELDQVSSR